MAVIEQGVCPPGPESRRNAAKARAESFDQSSMKHPSHTGCVTSQSQSCALAPEALAAEEVAQLYTRRWQVVLVFEELNSHYLLDELSAHRASVVEAFIMTLPVSPGSAGCVRSRLDRLRHRVCDMRRY